MDNKKELVELLKQLTDEEIECLIERFLDAKKEN